MKVSVLLICYNQRRFITDALEAALTQEDRDYELIIADDASTDGTQQAIEAGLARHPGRPVTYFSNARNLGLVANFWKAVSRATGDIIVPMAGDDISLPARVGLVRAHFERHPRCMALFAAAEIIDADGRPTGGRITSWQDGPSARNSLNYESCQPGRNLLAGRPFSGAAAGYRREVFGSYPNLIGKPINAEDEICMLRAMLLGTVDFLPAVHVNWRIHGTNQSFGLGPYRGPAQAGYYQRQANMCDQFIADLHNACGPEVIPETEQARLETAILRIRAEWKLWSACHEPGVRLGAWADAFVELARTHGSVLGALSRAVRPTIKMLTPFWLQRIFA
ncbi:MAG: hypothetical protein RJA37_1851 [Verrucomicrobiota bacterium]